MWLYEELRPKILVALRREVKVFGLCHLKFEVNVLLFRFEGRCKGKKNEVDCRVEERMCGF
jgi:hypothetical protein